MITRKEFSEYFNAIGHQFGSNGSPLWEAEYDLDQKCQWFVKVKPLHISSELTADGKYRIKDIYWDWCGKNMSGNTRCFSSNSDEHEEWWGFTNKDDLTLWMLRWA
jgi:hypothetical protein